MNAQCLAVGNRAVVQRQNWTPHSHTPSWCAHTREPRGLLTQGLSGTPWEGGLAKGVPVASRELGLGIPPQSRTPPACLPVQAVPFPPQPIWSCPREVSGLGPGQSGSLRRCRHAIPALTEGVHPEKPHVWANTPSSSIKLESYKNRPSGSRRGRKECIKSRSGWLLASH